MENTHETFFRQRRFITGNLRIVSALMFREATTRYGRDNIGLLWVFGEPLLFAAGVLIMWSFIRPPYDNGIALIPFLVTGYPPLILIRHTLSQGMYTVIVNTNLLYHRQVTLLHLFISRCALEIIGATISFVILLLILITAGKVDPPHSYLIIYKGWALLCWMSFAIAIILGSIVAMFEFFEKFAHLLTYMLIPVSGAFYMVQWLPSQYREIVLRIPFVNAMEMIRRGFFGEFYPTYYHESYTVYSCVVLTFIALIMLQLVRDRITVE